MDREGWLVHFSFDRFAYAFHDNWKERGKRTTKPMEAEEARLMLKEGWIERAPGWQTAYQISEAGRAYSRQFDKHSNPSG